MAKCKFDYFAKGIGEKGEECIHEAVGANGLCEFHQPDGFGGHFPAIAAFEREDRFDLRGFDLHASISFKKLDLEKLVDIRGTKFRSFLLFEHSHLDGGLRIEKVDVKTQLSLSGVSSPNVLIQEVRCNIFEISGNPTQGKIDHFEFLGGECRHSLAVTNCSIGDGDISGVSTKIVSLSDSKWSGQLKLEQMSLEGIGLAQAKFNGLHFKEISLSQGIVGPEEPSDGDFFFENCTFTAATECKRLLTKGRLIMRNCVFEEQAILSSCNPWSGGSFERSRFVGPVTFNACHFIPPTNKAPMGDLTFKDVQIDQSLMLSSVHWHQLKYAHSDENFQGAGQALQLEKCQGNEASFLGGQHQQLCVKGSSIQTMMIGEGFYAKTLEIEPESLRSLSLQNSQFGSGQLKSLPVESEVSMKWTPSSRHPFHLFKIEPRF